MTFTEGSKVEWKSQAQGYTRVKYGTVVAVVPAGCDVLDLLILDSGEPSYHSRQFDGGMRAHESYLVEVKTGKDGHGTPKLYWPRVSALCGD